MRFYTMCEREGSDEISTALTFSCTASRFLSDVVASMSHGSACSACRLCGPLPAWQQYAALSKQYSCTTTVYRCSTYAQRCLIDTGGIFGTCLIALHVF